VIGWGRIGGKQRQKEWIIMGRKISWEGDQWIVAQERGESEEGKNRDKKIVMVKLTTQEKKTGTATKSSVCLVRVLDLFLWCPILVLVLGVLGFVEKGAAPLVGQLGGDDWRVFFFSFLLSLLLWAIHCTWEL
jgi:hypothetical protein